MTRRLLTEQQVAERCGVKKRTVRTWRVDRRIPYIKVGHYIRIDERDLEAFIDGSRVPAETVLDRKRIAAERTASMYRRRTASPRKQASKG